MRSLRLLREARKRVLDASIRNAQRRAERASPRVYNAFHHLLATVQAHTTVLSPRTVATGLSRRFVEALLTIATHHCVWRRPLERWIAPPTASAELVLASLAAHLFALFPVPRFMNAAWLGTREQQHWYIRLGRGESVRAIDFPVRLSRSMAHAFRSAPDDLSILGALRWAQVRGLGGSPELARAVALTRLGREVGDEAFLAHVIAFLATQGEIDRPSVDPLVELFFERRRAQTFTALEGVWPVGTDPRAAIALFAIGRKTRTRILQEWAGPRPPVAKPRPVDLSWKPAPFGGLVWSAYRIAELRTGEELRQEGIAMRHCVVSYASKCAFGRSSIWSMTFEKDGCHQRVVTIEVDMKRRAVCQVKGYANERPQPAIVEVLRRWAEKQGLIMPTA